MTGWLVYTRDSAEKNRFFIDKLIYWTQYYGAGLSLILTGDIDGYLRDASRKPDFVINRSMTPELSARLEAHNIQVFNNSRVSRICNDKLLTYEYLSPHIAMLPTWRLRAGEYPAFYPSVVKPSDGHGGTDVYLLRGADDFEKIKDRFAGRDAVVQEVAELLGRDLRVYMIGRDIITAVLRSSERDFRANFSLGGTAEIYGLSGAQADIAVKAAALLDADMIGIDFLFRKNSGLVLNEIEDVAGCRTVYSLTGIDMAKLYVERVLKEMK